MRHGKRVNHLGRTSAHRKALLSNLATSLLLHKRITTTVAKAKALRSYIEPLITRSKNDTTHNRRVVFSYLQNKEAIKVLFDEISDKIAHRPGGYTRIIRLNHRPGDNAEMAMIELVDYNETYVKETAKKAATTTAPKKKTRRGSGKSKTAKTAERGEQVATPISENTSDKTDKNTAEK